MGDNIYITFWQSKLQEIEDHFQNGDIQFSIDVTGLDQFGDRQSYYSKFRIIKGALDISNNAYAHGRDFYQVFTQSDYFKKYLKDKTIAVRITRDLKLEIEMDNNEQDYFTKEDLIQLKKFTGQPHDKNDPVKEETYQHLKHTYSKMEYWMEQVAARTFPDGQTNIIKKPTNQANKFEDYLWTKIYPNQALKDFKLLAYTLTLSNSEKGFCVKIDTVSLGDNDPLRKAYFNYRGDFFNSPIVKLLDSDEVLSKDWEYLISKSVNIIKELENDYNKLLKIMGYNQSIDGKKKNGPISEQQHPLNIILYGPPGTGKTYHSIDRAVSIATGKSSNHESNKIEFDRLRAEGQIEFLTFHQNYTYEDFIVGLKPDVEEITLKFLNHRGIFYQICKRARDNYQASKLSEKLQSLEELVDDLILNKISPEQPLEMKTVRGKPFWLTDFSDKTIYLRKSTGSEIHTLSITTLIDIAEGRREMVSGLSVYYNPIIEYLNSNRKSIGTKEEEKRYVLIIDEINRANISKVFGELITLLEPDKRIDSENELRVSLPNGEKDFAIPPNLYIIGTMNTADKSIALIDIALRRRFEFEGKYPDYSVITDPEAKRLLIQINKAVFEKKKSADFLIGHAYFMNVTSIETVLQKKVIPLLSEYFMGRTDFVKDVFKDTDWEVNYNLETYQWVINKKNGVAV